MKYPYSFDEFFDSGKEESISPFLTRSSRKWGKHTSLKSACLAGFLLLVAFSVYFYSPTLSFLFLSFVYFLVGTPALIGALNDLKNFEINIDVLMTFAAFIALSIDSAMEGALLLVLFELSHGMEENVSHQALSALHNLNQLAPKFAHVITPDRSTYEKSVKEIVIGTRLLIKAGETVPLDSKIVHGTSSLNVSHLTGESLPLCKQVGDELPAGAKNLEAALEVEVIRTSSDSTLSRMIVLITQAKASKPKLQNTLDRFGKYYATGIMTLTGLLALFLPWMTSMGYLGSEGSIYRSLAFLISASPCALIIATPTAYLSAISACAKRGILLKGGMTLDGLAQCSKIAFDKTGTLTTGILKCTGIDPLHQKEITLEKAVSIAYGLERQIVHPIATAICVYAVEQNIQPEEVEDFQWIPGLGLQGTLKNTPILLGLPAHIEKTLPIFLQKLLASSVKTAQKKGLLSAALSIGEDLFLLQFSDEIRKDAKLLIQTLKQHNHLDPLILTGDHQENALLVGKELQIDKIFSNLRPEDKLNQVSELSNTYGLAMVGDGMNDAPALARATIGISLGKIGSATAVDASDVILLNDDLSLLSWLFDKAHQTKSIVKQNLIVALGVICLVTLPALLGWVPLWTAVLLHEGGTVLVGLNSLRLLKHTHSYIN